MTWVAVFNIPCDCRGFSLAWLLALIYEVDRVACRSVGLLYTRYRPSVRCKRSLKVEQQQKSMKAKSLWSSENNVPILLTTPSLTFRLWSSENQIVGVGSRSGRRNQSQCIFPRFVVDWFGSSASGSDSDNLVFIRSISGTVSDGVLSRIGTLFSLDHKLYAS